MPRFIIDFEVHEKAHGTISLVGADETDVRNQLSRMSIFDLQEYLHQINASTEIKQVFPGSHLINQVEDQLIADFKLWSGGFPPDECEAQSIDAYVDSSLPEHYSGLEEEIRGFLRMYITT